MSAQGAVFPARCNVPHLDRSVEEHRAGFRVYSGRIASGEESLAVVRERQARHAGRVQGDGFLARFHVPHLDRSVRTCREKPLAVARDRQAVHPKRMAAKSKRFLAGFEVPHLDLAWSVIEVVATCGEETLAVTAQHQARQHFRMSAQGTDRKSTRLNSS